MPKHAADKEFNDLINMARVSYAELSSVEYTYVVLLEGVYFFAHCVKEYGPTLPGDLALYLKYLQAELDEFVNTSCGTSKAEKLHSFLSLFRNIFHLTDSCSLINSADKSISNIFKIIIVSRAAALVKSGVLNVSEIAKALNRSTVYTIQNEQLHEYLRSHMNFLVLRSGSVKLVERYHIDRFDCEHYHYVMNYFSQYLKERCVKYEDIVVEFGKRFCKDGFLVLCALYRNKHLFTFRDGEISLTVKARKKILKPKCQTLPLETLQVRKKPVSKKPVSLRVNELYGNKLNGWIGKVDYLESKFGFIKALVDLKNTGQRFLAVYFYKDAFETLVCFDDLRDVVCVCDVVVFDAVFDCNSMYCDREKRYWRAVSVRPQPNSSSKLHGAKSDSESSKKAIASGRQDTSKFAVDDGKVTLKEFRGDKERKMLEMWMKHETLPRSGESSGASTPPKTVKDPSSYSSDKNNADNETFNPFDTSTDSNSSQSKKKKKKKKKNKTQDSSGDIHREPIPCNTSQDSNYCSSDNNTDNNEALFHSGVAGALSIPSNTSEGTNSSCPGDKTNYSNETWSSSDHGTSGVPVKHSYGFHTTLNSSLERDGENVSLECGDSAASQRKGNRVVLRPFGVDCISGDGSLVQNSMNYDPLELNSHSALSGNDIHNSNAFRPSKLYTWDNVGDNTRVREVNHQPEHLCEQSITEMSVSNKKCLEVFDTLFSDLHSCEKADSSSQDQIQVVATNNSEAVHNMEIRVNNDEGKCRISEASNSTEADLLNSLQSSPQKDDSNAEKKTIYIETSFCRDVETESHLATEVLNVSSAISGKLLCESPSLEQDETLNLSKHEIADEVKECDSIFDDSVIRSDNTIKYSKSFSLETSSSISNKDVGHDKEAAGASDISCDFCLTCGENREELETGNCCFACSELICTVNDSFKLLKTGVAQITENLEQKSAEQNVEFNTDTLDVRDENINKEKLELPIDNAEISRINAICVIPKDSFSGLSKENGKLDKQDIAEFKCCPAECDRYRSSPAGHGNKFDNEEITTQLSVENVPSKKICADAMHSDSTRDPDISFQVCFPADIVSETLQTNHENLLGCSSSDKSEDIGHTNEAEALKVPHISSVEFSESYPELCYVSPSECTSASEYSLAQYQVGEMHSSEDHDASISDTGKLDFTCTPDHASTSLELKHEKNTKDAKAAVQLSTVYDKFTQGSPEHPPDCDKLSEINETSIKPNDYVDASTQGHAKFDVAKTASIVCGLGNSSATEGAIQLTTKSGQGPALHIAITPWGKSCAGSLISESLCRPANLQEVHFSASVLGSCHQTDQNSTSYLPHSEENETNSLVAQSKEHSIPLVSVVVNQLSPKENTKVPLSSPSIAKVESQDNTAFSLQDLNSCAVQNKRCISDWTQHMPAISTGLKDHSVVETFMSCPNVNTSNFTFGASCCSLQELGVSATKLECCACYSAVEHYNFRLPRVQHNSSLSDLDIAETNTKLSSLWPNHHSDKEFLFIFSEILLMNEHSGILLGHYRSRTVHLYFVQEAYKEYPHSPCAFNSLCVGDAVLSFVPYFDEESDLLLPTFVTLIDVSKLNGLGCYKNLCAEQYFKQYVNYSLNIDPKMELHHESFVDFNFSIAKYGRPVPQSSFAVLRRILRGENFKGSAKIRRNVEHTFEDVCSHMGPCSTFSEFLPSRLLENDSCGIPFILCDNSQAVNIPAVENKTNLSACQSPQMSASSLSYVSCSSSVIGTLEEVEDDFKSCSSFADDLNDSPSLKAAEVKNVPSSPKTDLKSLLPKEEKTLTSASKSSSNEGMALALPNNTDTMLRSFLSEAVNFNNIVNTETEFAISSASTINEAMQVKDIGHTFCSKVHSARGCSDNLGRNASFHYSPSTSAIGFKLKASSGRLIFPFKPKCRRSILCGHRKAKSTISSKNCSFAYAPTVPKHIVLAKVLTITDSGILLQSMCETVPFVCNFPISNNEVTDIKEVVQVNCKVKLHMGLSRIGTAFPHVLCLELFIT